MRIQIQKIITQKITIIISFQNIIISYNNFSKNSSKWDYHENNCTFSNDSIA